MNIFKLLDMTLTGTTHNLKMTKNQFKDAYEEWKQRNFFQENMYRISCEAFERNGEQWITVYRERKVWVKG